MVAGRFQLVASETDLDEGRSLVVLVGRQPVLIYKNDGIIYAMNDECPHAKALLSDGRFIATTIICASHGARFNLLSGKHIGSMNVPPLVLRKTKRENGNILVEIL